MNEIEEGTRAALEAAPVAASGDALGRLIELMDAGGPVVAILLAMSIVALAIVLVKLWQFWRARLGDRRIAEEALRLFQAGRVDKALERLHGARNPVAQVLGQAIRGQRKGIAESKVREEIVRVGGDVLEQLRVLLRPLEVISTLAPLLGLFGTVLGMIEAFQRLSESGSRVDPATLAGGIWEALLTTAVGLAVAIPAVAILSWLERRVERVGHELDSVVTRVFTEDLSEGSASTQDQERHAHAHVRSPALAANE